MAEDKESVAEVKKIQSTFKNRSVKKYLYILSVSVLVYILLSTRISIKISTQRRTLVNLNTENFFLVTSSQKQTEELLTTVSTSVKPTQETIGTRPVTREQRTTKAKRSNTPNWNSQVLVLAYQRTGSSFLGDLFNIHDDVFYWFEPLDGVYSSMFGTAHGWAGPQDIYINEDGNPRTISQHEHNTVVEALANIFTCNMTSLPAEVPLHTFTWTFTNHNKDLNNLKMCLKNKSYGRTADSCRKQHLRRVCPSKFGLDPESSEQCRQRLLFKNSTASGSVNINRPSRLDGVDRFDEPQLYLPNPHARRRSGFRGHIFRGRGVSRSLPDAVSGYENCRSRLYGVSKPCVVNFSEYCYEHSTRAIKTVRARMSHVEDLLKIFPNLTVIHTFRDPRGVVSSRYNTVFESNYGTKNMVKEAEVYCRLLAEDIKLRKQLEIKYPGRLTHVVYENLANQPQKEAKRLLDFVGVPWTKVTESWLKVNTNGTVTGKNKKIVIKNSTNIAEKWKQKVPKKLLRNINRACKSLYDLVGPLWQHMNF